MKKSQLTIIAFIAVAVIVIAGALVFSGPFVGSLLSAGSAPTSTPTSKPTQSPTASQTPLTEATPTPESTQTPTPTNAPTPTPDIESGWGIEFSSSYDNATGTFHFENGKIDNHYNFALRNFRVEFNFTINSGSPYGSQIVKTELINFGDIPAKSTKQFDFTVQLSSGLVTTSTVRAEYDPFSVVWD